MGTPKPFYIHPRHFNRAHRLGEKIFQNLPPDKSPQRGECRRLNPPQVGNARGPIPTTRGMPEAQSPAGGECQRPNPSERGMLEAQSPAGGECQRLNPSEYGNRRG